MRIAKGNVARLIVAFANRDLTQTEQQNLVILGTLPDSTGVDQPTVQLDYWIDLDPDDNPPTSTLTAPVHDSTGVYHFDVLIDQSGIWQYSGYSLDSGGSPLARTRAGRFDAGTG